jgi:hypothetical protein
LLYRFGMTRVLLLGLALLAAACGNKTFPSLCATSVPAPDGCNTPCNPTPGVPAGCPPGLHCSADGKCDLVCTQSGTECGDDHVCTADGFCIPKDGPPPADSDTCPSVHVTAAPTTPTVELLLDQSGSMNATYGNTIRWNAMLDSLINPTTGVVARLQSRVAFGASLYSNKSMEVGGRQVGIQPCPTLIRPTPSARAVNNFQPIANMLNANTWDEDTPTAESIDAVVADFKANPPAPGSPPIIVLATDGLPDTCADADPPDGARQAATNAASVAAAQRAFAAGIKLYFLFIGDDEAGDHPQEMANAGAGLPINSGNAKFYEATNPAELSMFLDEIIGGVLSCDLTLSRAVDPGDVGNGIVTANGQRLTFETDWNVDPDGRTLHILGAACEMLKNSPNATVDAEFSCGAIIF